ncbi:hypothetical protein GCM10022409_36880 [Hymenobacter glaciei]|uniref:Lipoprotein n=1 Tax=Hymenobacter glaciei TaxID=877209 RepID=A0ABP7UM54_9BACT
MNLFRTLGAVALLALGWAGTSSCLKAPDFPLEPTITFNSLKKTYEAPRMPGATPADTLEFAIDFQDGDGDLGLDADDAAIPPYNSPTGGHNNLSTSNNYFIQPFKRVISGGIPTFVPFYTPGGFPGEYDGRYPRLETTTDAKPAPLKGTLRYKLRLPLNRTSYSANDVLRFEISIMDRAMHQSNAVTTTEVTLGP